MTSQRAKLTRMAAAPEAQKTGDKVLHRSWIEAGWGWGDRSRGRAAG
jgi:hypothetical protein